jgi:signal transduction histidine kinase
MTEKVKKRIQALKKRLAQLGDAQTTERVDVMTELAWETTFLESMPTLEMSLEAYALSEKLSYEHGIASSSRNLGLVYCNLSDYNSALRYAYAALNHFELIGDKIELSSALTIIGITYWNLGNFDLALDYLHKAERELLGSEYEYRLPWVLTTLGGVYRDLGDLEKSLSYHQKSLELFKNYDIPLGVARALSGIGNVYEGLGDHEKALQHHGESLKIFRHISNPQGEARALNDMGVVHQALDQLDEALSYHQSSLRIREKLANRNAEITSLLNIGRTYNQKRAPAKALEALSKALKCAEEIDVRPKLYQIHHALADAFELQGDLRSALKHLKCYQQIKEEVFSDEAKTRLKNLQIHFEVEKTEKEAEIHRLKNLELKKALDDLEKVNRELRETQSHLVQSERMALLGQLTAGIAHELNNPIGAIKSSADILLRSIARIQQLVEGSASAKELAENARFQKAVEVLELNSKILLAASERIASIVGSLKNFARLDEADFKMADIHQGLESTLTLIQHEFKKGVAIHKQFGKVSPIYCYPNQLNQVFMTLLRNAAQAIEKQGRITIQTGAENGNVFIRIRDTGRGIPPEIRASLFQLNFITKSSRVGLGMGLHNAYNIIQRHRGQIEFESEVGKGTEFRITLPTNAALFEK